MNSPNLIVLHATKSQPAGGVRPGSHSSRIRRWLGCYLIAVLLFAICGSASAQLVKVVSWQNGIWALDNNVGSVTGLDLNDETTVLVVGLYGDNSSSYSGVTLGGFRQPGL